MKTLLAALLLLLSTTALADTVFYTDSWTSINTTNWNVVAGTPQIYYGNGLGDAVYSYMTMLIYRNTPATVTDYSVTTTQNCSTGESNPNREFLISYYLRASGATYYQVIFDGTTDQWGDFNSATISLYRYVNGNGTLLASTSAGCGQIVSAIQGSQINVTVGDTQAFNVTDSTITSGSLGVGTQYCNAGTTITYTALTSISAPPPNPPTNLTGSAPYATTVNLSWTAPTGGATSYNVYRNGEFMANTTATSIQDHDPGSFSYTVTSVNVGGLESTTAAGPLVLTTPALTYAAPDLGAAIDYATTWGAGPEKVSLFSGSLGLRIPLIQLKQQSRGTGFTVMAAYNSQFWSHDAAGDHMTAMDTGNGLGWTVQIAAIYPVFNAGGTLVWYELQDIAGVIHKLYAVETSTPVHFRSRDSSYMTWDNVAHTLLFKDGSLWTFNCESMSPEPDAGVRYPTELREANGGLITVTYLGANSRINTIVDSQATYTFWWTNFNMGVPHLFEIYHAGQTNNPDATFGYYTSNNPPASNGYYLISPFSGSAYDSTRRVFPYTLRLAGGRDLTRLPTAPIRTVISPVKSRR